MENLKPGAELWLDGIDGFFDQFFESRRAGESMSFIALPPGDRHRMLRDLALFAGRAAQRAR